MEPRDPIVRDPDAPERALRIGFVADDLYPGFGGQASATEGHIAALRARRHEVRVVAGRIDAQNGEPPEAVEMRRVPAWQPGETQTNFALPSPTAILWLVRWADVVQVNTPTPLAIAAGVACRGTRTPCVMGVHTQLESSALHFDTGRRAIEIAVGTWFRLLYSTPQALTAPTPFAAEMARRFTHAPVHVVSNGVEIPAAIPSPVDARRRLGRRFGSLVGARLVAYVGRLAPEKRPQELLELAAMWRDDVVLAIAGKGPMERDLREETRRRGLDDRVEFLGFVDHETKSDLLAAADLFVMPSPTELQSIATLEAMAHGCAVAAAGYDTSAVPSVVREAGAGIVYDPADMEGAARAIQQLLDDPDRLRSFQTAARRGAERHRVSRSAEVLERIYLELIERGRDTTWTR